MPLYNIVPKDLLFFRDGRPMGESGGTGYGAIWPHPAIFFDAVHAAFYRAYPLKQDWEQVHLSRPESGERRLEKRFGALKTVGPFPVKDRNWYFVSPMDAAMYDTSPMVPIKDSLFKSNLPHPLKYVVGRLVDQSKNENEKSKEEKGTLWNKVAFETYLRRQNDKACAFIAEWKEIMDSEWYTGIGIDSINQVQDGERIYSAEYIRLNENVSLGTFASLKLKSDPGKDAMDYLFSDSKVIVLGGQQRACMVEKLEKTDITNYLPVAPEVKGNKVKWILLSPAIFIRMQDNAGNTNHPGGWLPNWVRYEDGKVMLTAGPGKNKAKRKGLSEGRQINATLVAAVVGKPQVISGWSTDFVWDSQKHEYAVIKNGANSTFLAVPAGSVYYFEAPTSEDAMLLADALNWHGSARSEVYEIINRRSTLFGEKGFGIGVCGEWELREI